MGRMPLSILKNIRAAGGSCAKPKPSPPPMTLLSASTATDESSTDCMVRVGLSFCTSPSTEPRQVGSKDAPHHPDHGDGRDVCRRLPNE
jgi:hypothetical protein